MSLINVIENPVFISMVTSIFAWIIFYFIVYFIAVQQGVRKDIVRNAYNLSLKMEKIASSMKQDLDENGPKNIKTAFSRLKTIKHCGKKASTILQVYLLEETENLDVKAAESRLKQIAVECGDVARAYRVDSSVWSIENEIDDVIKLSSEASSILKTVMKKREEAKLLQL